MQAWHFGDGTALYTAERVGSKTRGRAYTVEVIVMVLVMVLVMVRFRGALMRFEMDERKKVWLFSSD